MRFGDYYSGLLHPLTALEHLLAFVALGTLAGVLGAKPSRRLLLSFGPALAAGAWIAARSEDAVTLHLLALLSLVAIGGLLALGRHLDAWLILAVSILAGLAHGYENGRGFPAGGDAGLYVLGVATSGYLLCTLISAALVAVRERPRWLTVACRTAGSWIAAVGVMMLGFALAN
jgi:urease accessory protein